MKEEQGTTKMHVPRTQKSSYKLKFDQRKNVLIELKDKIEKISQKVKPKCHLLGWMGWGSGGFDKKKKKEEEEERKGKELMDTDNIIVIVSGGAGEWR